MRDQRDVTVAQSIAADDRDRSNACARLTVSLSLAAFLTSCSLLFPGPEPVPKPEPEPVQPVELTPPETPPVEKKITHHDEIILLPNADGSVGAVVVRQHGVEKMLAELTRRRAAEISVIGHTDTFGSIQFNDKLSLQRARRVRQLLIARGIPSDSISIVGRGERELLIPTRDKVHEPRNRRVEINVR